MELSLFIGYFQLSPTSHEFICQYLQEVNPDKRCKYLLYLTLIESPHDLFEHFKNNDQEVIVCFQLNLYYQLFLSSHSER